MPLAPAFAPALPLRTAAPRRARAAPRRRRAAAVAEPAVRSARAPAALRADAGVGVGAGSRGGRRVYDVAVVGAGPAGLALAAALVERGLGVCVFDPMLGRPWPNHYGVWRDEFERVGLETCASNEYRTTAVYVGGEATEGKTVVDRAYIRVDRVKLKARLMERCLEGGVWVEEARVLDVKHVDDSRSVLRVARHGCGGRRDTMEADTRAEEPSARQVGCQDKTLNPLDDEEDVTARMVVDCTGHALAFTQRVTPSEYVKPMEQAAYGIEADVEAHPYQVDQMLLMDFRDEHMQATPSDAMASAARPTFLYVFPTSPTRAFFEETSVIAPNAVPFEELKRRLYLRLAHDGVVVRNVVEEEFSLIPMGGTVPDCGQRVVSFGGAACLVHPATGYMVARTMRLASDTAAVIAKGLVRIGEDGRVADVSADVWRHVWSARERRQRDFLNFGAELLGSLGATASRGFFDAFFRLPDKLWRDFLSAEMHDPGERMYFALYFFAIANNQIRGELLAAMWTIGRWKLLRSVMPLAFVSGKD